MSYWYMASVYTSYPEGKEQAFVEACKQVTRLQTNNPGEVFYSPIVHCHAMRKYGGFDNFDWEGFIRPIDFAFLKKAKAMIVIMMPEWQTSVGINDELKYARKLGKPILYVEPGTKEIPRIV